MQLFVPRARVLDLELARMASLQCQLLKTVKAARAAPCQLQEFGHRRNSAAPVSIHSFICQAAALLRFFGECTIPASDASAASACVCPITRSPVAAASTVSGQVHDAAVYQM